MMARPSPPPEQLTHVVNVRLAQRDHAELRAAASAAGMTVSAYCRRRMLGHVVVPHTDLAVIRELRRLGGLVKQVHTQSGGLYSRQTAAMLADLGDAVRRLSRA